MESSHKSNQGEAHKIKANLKRVTDELSSVREQNTELVKRDKERQAAHSQFEQRLALQLADELNAHSHIGIATSKMSQWNLYNQEPLSDIASVHKSVYNFLS